MKKQIPTISGILIVLLVAGLAGASVLFLNQETENNFVDKIEQELLDTDEPIIDEPVSDEIISEETIIDESTTDEFIIDETEVTAESISTIVNANNKFALDFYFKLKDGKEGENIFFSPYSISTALAIAYEGARNQTAREIQSVFYFPDDDSIRRSSIAAVYNRLNKEDAKYEMHTANSLWVQENYQIRNDFADIVERHYGGKINNVDFINATEETRRIINNWVENKTNEKIKDLFPEGSLGDLTRLVLANAVYFNGNWVKQFEKDKTKKEDFRMSDDQKVKVPIMRRTDDNAIFNYTETGKLQILEMLYEGEDLSMLIFLPKNGNLESLEELLSVENINQWRGELKKERVDVYIPKFTFSSKYLLKEILEEMGMPTAFVDPEAPWGADFSGIRKEKDICIQTVVHQAFIDVHERGTEAAAATGIGMGPISAPQTKIFRANHAFLFLIQERESGNIIFIGRVIDPR